MEEILKEDFCSCGSTTMNSNFDVGNLRTTKNLDSLQSNKNDDIQQSEHYAETNNNIKNLHNANMDRKNKVSSIINNITNKGYGFRNRIQPQIQKPAPKPMSPKNKNVNVINNVTNKPKNNNAYVINNATDITRRNNNLKTIVDNATSKKNIARYTPGSSSDDNSILYGKPRVNYFSSANERKMAKCTNKGIIICIIIVVVIFLFAMIMKKKAIFNSQFGYSPSVLAMLKAKKMQMKSKKFDMMRKTIPEEYKKAYDAGVQNGIAHGYKNGYKTGLKSGIDQGLAEGFKVLKEESTITPTAPPKEESTTVPYSLPSEESTTKTNEVEIEENPSVQGGFISNDYHDYSNNNSDDVF